MITDERLQEIKERYEFPDGIVLFEEVLLDDIQELIAAVEAAQQQLAVVVEERDDFLVESGIWRVKVEKLEQQLAEAAAEASRYMLLADAYSDVTGARELREENEGKLLFQDKARLEVSGIRKGGSSRLGARVTQKLNQVTPSDGLLLPAYIVVVEFGTPKSQVVKK